MDLSLDEYIKQKNITAPVTKISVQANDKLEPNKQNDVRSRLSRPGSRLLVKAPSVPVHDARSRLGVKERLDHQDIRHKLTKRNISDAREKLNQRRGLTNQPPPANKSPGAPLLQQNASHLHTSIMPPVLHSGTQFPAATNPSLEPPRPPAFEPLKVRIQGFHPPQPQPLQLMHFPPTQNLPHYAPVSHQQPPVNNLSLGVLNIPPPNHPVASLNTQPPQLPPDAPVYVDEAGQVIHFDSQEVYEDIEDDLDYGESAFVQTAAVPEPSHQAIPVQLSNPTVVSPAHGGPRDPYGEQSHFIGQQTSVIPVLSQGAVQARQRTNPVHRPSAQQTRRPSRIYIKNPNSVDQRKPQAILRSSSNTQATQLMKKPTTSRLRTTPQGASAVKPPPTGYKVFITNLVDDITDADIKELFGSVGTLRRARLLGQGKAEAVYADKEHAISACKQFNSRALDGQPMRVRLVTAATQQPQRDLEKRTAASRLPAAQLGLVQKALFSR